MGTGPRGSRAGDGGLPCGRMAGPAVRSDCRACRQRSRRKLRGPGIREAWRLEGEEGRQPGQAEQAQLAREGRLCSGDPPPQLRGAAGTPEEARGRSEATHSLCGPGC